MSDCKDFTFPEECQRRHEQIMVIEAMNKNRDVRDAELKAAINSLVNVTEDLRHTVEKVSRIVAEEKVKLTNDEKRIEVVEKRQDKVVIGFILAIIYGAIHIAYSVFHVGGK